jgi:hypothetical protein
MEKELSELTRKHNRIELKLRKDAVEDAERAKNWW